MKPWPCTRSARRRFDAAWHARGPGTCLGRPSAIKTAGAAPRPFDLRQHRSRSKGQDAEAESFRRTDAARSGPAR